MKGGEEKEGNAWHIVGHVQLLRGRALKATGETNKLKCTQATNSLKEGQCILNTAQYVEKEKDNQPSSSGNYLKMDGHR